MKQTQTKIKTKVNKLYPLYILSRVQTPKASFMYRLHCIEQEMESNDLLPKEEPPLENVVKAQEGCFSIVENTH